MALDPDINGKVIRNPGSVYDLPWVKGTGVVRKTVDPTNLGWRPKIGIPDTYSMFGHSAGRTNSKAENEAAKTLGNKWVKK